MCHCGNSRADTRPHAYCRVSLNHQLTVICMRKIGGTGGDEINGLEIELLNALGFQMDITPEEFELYETALMIRHSKETAAFDSVSSPASPAIATTSAPSPAPSTLAASSPVPSSISSPFSQ